MTIQENSIFPSEVVQKIANARSRAEIYSILVNELKSPLAYDQAAIVQNTFFKTTKIIAISGLVDIEHSGPYPVWLRRLSKSLRHFGRVETYSSDDEINPGNWEKFAPAFLLTAPLTENFFSKQTLLLFKTQAWTESEKFIVNTIGDIAAGALSRPFTRTEEESSKASRKKTWAASLIALLIALFPVRLSSIAPAETVPADPLVIAPSFPAVVKRIVVAANDRVQKDQILVELDDIDQQAKVQVTKRELDVADADLKRLSQLSFQDPNSRYRLAEAKGQFEIKKLLYQKAELELERTKLRAPAAGLAIVTDPLDWIGKPVQTGEKIVLIAEPENSRIRLWVPASDGAILQQGLTGDLYLDSDPWKGRDIKVVNWAFEPELSPAGIMSFRAQAEPAKQDWPHAILGLHGVAHLSGERLPLVLYMLRKPIIFLRQTFAI